MAPDTPPDARPDSRQGSTRAQHAAALVAGSIKRLNRRLRRARVDHGVSSSKLNVLGHLVRNGAMTATDLAALDRIQPQSLTRMMAALEERGLIQREQAQADRRQMRIMITRAGRKLLDRDAQRQEAWLSRAMTDMLTDRELDLLGEATRLLDRLAAMSDAGELVDA